MQLGCCWLLSQEGWGKFHMEVSAEDWLVHLWMRLLLLSAGAMWDPSCPMVTAMAPGSRARSQLSPRVLGGPQSAEARSWGL